VAPAGEGPTEAGAGRDWGRRREPARVLRVRPESARARGIGVGLGGAQRGAVPEAQRERMVQLLRAFMLAKHVKTDNQPCKVMEVRAHMNYRRLVCAHQGML